MFIFYRFLFAAIRFTAGSLTKYRIVRMDLNGLNEVVVKNNMIFMYCIAADVTGKIKLIFSVFLVAPYCICNKKDLILFNFKTLSCMKYLCWTFGK